MPKGTRLHFLSTAAVICAAPWCLVAASPAQAQDTASADDAKAQQTTSSDDEIVVTARRRAENLLDVPVAITAVSGDTLVEKGVLVVSDLVRLAPGLSMSPAGTRGFNQLVVGIRGQRNGDFSPSADPAVGVYFGEVPQNSPQGLNSAFFDLESVQVLKGPQGTLFGRNATGGAVLITPNAPTRDFEGYVRGAMGNYDLWDVEGVLNAPLGDNLAIRFAGKHTTREGYLTDVNTHVDYNNIDRTALRLSLKWQPATNFQSTTIGTYFIANTNGEGVRLIKTSNLASAAVQASFNLYKDIPKYSIALSFGTPGSPFADGKTRDWTLSLQNTTQVDVGGVTFKNIAGYRNIYDLGHTDGEGTALQLSNSAFSDQIQEYSEEFQISGQAGALKYVTGVYGFYEHAHEDILTFGLTPAPRVITDFDVYNTSYSAYADFSYDLSSLVEGLGISAGGRIAHDKRQWNTHALIETAANSGKFTCRATGILLPTRDRDLCITKYEVSFTRPTWEVTLNYKASPDSMLYASYRRGYRTGGFSTAATDPLIASRPFLPETVDAFEIGSKNEFELGSVPVRLNVAAYYDNYRDIQRKTTVFVNALLGLKFNTVVNAAKAHIYGGEIEFGVRPTKNLDLSLGYALTKPVYDEWFDPFNVGTTVYQIDISGSHFISNPENTLNLSATYKLPVAPDAGEPSIQVSYYHQSETYTFNDINTDNCGAGVLPAGVVYTPCLNHDGKVPGYGLVNLRLNWDNVLNQGFDMSIYVENLTDKYYYPSGVSALNSAGQGSFTAGIGAPRMVQFSLRVPFGGAHR